MELGTDGCCSLSGCLMSAVTHVCTIDYVAKMLDEDVELLEAIAYNNDNLTYGSIISVYVGPDETITALVLSRLRSGPSTHLCDLSLKSQGAFAT